MQSKIIKSDRNLTIKTVYTMLFYFRNSLFVALISNLIIEISFHFCFCNGINTLSSKLFNKIQNISNKIFLYLFANLQNCFILISSIESIDDIAARLRSHTHTHTLRYARLFPHNNLLLPNKDSCNPLIDYDIARLPGIYLKVDD